MIQIRSSADRGYADHGWLRSFHTFSFAGYQDPEHVRFRTLRVINEDWVRPGYGFGEHPHQDMEIVTCVLEGALEHRDSMGNGAVLRPGEFQCMTAGTGITHSEFNPSSTEPVHLYQIWLFPERRGLPPAYDQKAFPPEEFIDRWRIVASSSGEEGSLTIRTDASIRIAKLGATSTLTYDFAPGRHGWLQVMQGDVKLGENLLSTGDGAAISDQPSIEIVATTNANLMLFDLP